jgi:hypothetical protein
MSLTSTPHMAIMPMSLCGCRQVVRQRLPKPLFVGSNPITRFSQKSTRRNEVLFSIITLTSKTGYDHSCL